MHDSHNDYPLALEKLVVQDECLSLYCTKIKVTFNLASDKTTKLIPTLFNKKKYVLHIRMLELYLELGMTLNKIHIILKINESTWLERYISFNTKKGQSQNQNLIFF